MRRIRGGAAWWGLIAAAGLLATACSGDDSDNPDPPEESGDVKVPEGVTLTSGGSTIDLGRPASFVYKPQNGARTVLTVRVTRVVRGKPQDLREYDLDGVPKGSMPFYVDATVRNAGPAVLSNATVPLFGLDDGNRYFPAVEVNGALDRCKPVRLAGKIAPGKSVEGCLLFTVPKGTTFKAVQARTTDLSNPISWKP